MTVFCRTTDWGRTRGPRFWNPDKGNPQGLSPDRPPPRESLARRLGFTLLELLVVIGVIGVLSSLLLPALWRAKEASRRVTCMHRQKQWVFGTIDYAQENEGILPREGYHNTGDVWVNTWAEVRARNRGPGSLHSEDVWYNAVPNHSFDGVEPASFYSFPFTRREDFYTKNNFFHCPSAKFPAAATKPTFQDALFSIAMNSQLITWPDDTVTLARIEASDPESLVLFMDNRLEGEVKVDPFQEDRHLGQPAAHASRFSARHRGGGVIGFAGGHVEWVEGSRVVATNGEFRGYMILPGRDIRWHTLD